MKVLPCLQNFLGKCQDLQRLLPDPLYGLPVEGQAYPYPPPLPAQDCFKSNMRRGIPEQPRLLRKAKFATK